MPRRFLKPLEHQLLIFIFLFLAVATILTPLQHYIALSRYQHWGLGLFIFALGHIIQLIWSWQSLGRWMRISYLWSALYISSAGILFFANPWLDARISLESSRQDKLRSHMILTYSVLALPAVWFWIKCFQEMRGKRTEEKDNTR